MNKWLLFLLVIVGLLWWMKARGRRAGPHPDEKDGRTGPAQESSASKPAGPAQEMVQCAHCGLHLPRSEALLSLDGQATYCCAAHLQAGPRA